MPVQPNKKVLQALQSNKLTIKDVRTRPKYWNKPWGYYTECPNCNWKLFDAGYWKWPDDPKAKEKVWEYYGGEKCLRCETTLKNVENEENYMDFICYTGWNHWNRTYKFLPLLDTYNKIKKAVNEELEGFKADYRQKCVKKFKDPGEEFKTIQEFQNHNGKSKTFKRGSFRLMPYFVIANANNTITLITQNTRQLDFAKLDIAFFWRGNKWRNKAKTLKDPRLLFWCTNVSYINDKKATCILTLEKDYMWSYYGNVMESRAKLTIFTSQLGNSHEIIEKDNEGNITTKESLHKEDYNQDSEHYCRACDNCFDFCGDLRNKATKYVGKNGYNVANSPTSWQPTFTIGMSMPGKPMGKVVIKGDSNENSDKVLQVPNAIVLFENYNGDRSLGNFISGASEQKPTLYYLLDGYHFDPIANKGVNEHGLACKDPNTFSMYWPNIGNDITKRGQPEFPNGYYWDELPREYADQPHLLNHSSAQVYFQRKLLFTANWKHLLVRRKASSKANGKRGISAQGLLWVLGYRIKINSSIAGILYNFESGDIFFKWELKVKGSYQNVGWIDWLLEKLFKMLGMGDEPANMNTIVGGNYSAEEGEKKPGFVGAIRNLWTLFKEAIKGWVKKQIGTDFNQVFDAERYQKMSGIDGSNTNDLQQTESEAQTERMKKSTAKGQNRIVEPSIFYTNTIDLAYDFFEYGNRSMSNPFEIRAETSKLLHDNLYNNNNKNPIQQFNIRVRHLKQAITEGDWQAEVDLFDFDTTDGWWKRTAGGGTTFYKNESFSDEKDLNEYFPNWQPVFRTIQSATKGETGDAGGGQGQEEVDIEVKKGASKRNDAKSEDTVCQYDNRIIFIQKPALVNSSGQNIIYDYLGQTPGWTGNEWPCDPSGWEKTWTLPQDTYTYKWKIWTGQDNEGVHVGVSEVQLTLTHPPGGGQGKGAGVVIMSLESSTPDITNMKFNFKEEKIDFVKEEEYKETEYKEPDFSPGETEMDAEGEVETDEEKEDMEAELEEWGDRDAGEHEADDDWEVELEQETEQEQEEEFELEDEAEIEDEQEQEQEEEKEDDKEDEQEQEIETGNDDNDNDLDG